MHDEQKEQSRIAIAAFIVATTIALMQLDGPSSSPGKDLTLIELLLGVAMLAALISSVFAVLFILSKAAELRYQPSVLQTMKFLVKHKISFYGLAISVYVPVIYLLGGLIIYIHLEKFAKDNSRYAWLPTAITLFYVAYTYIRARMQDSKEKTKRKN